MTSQLLVLDVCSLDAFA
ncbi:DUF645 family protein [Vibrio mimicus]|nr:DUF645 family protein [Vibrio mimicus]